MKSIHVECDADEVLVKSLGFVKKGISHHNGKYPLLSTVSKCQNQVALIDEDPGKPKHSYVNQIKLITEENNIKVFVDNKSANLLVALCPALEEWLLDLCVKMKININVFDLPDSAGKLHKFNHKRNDKLEILLNTLIENKCPSLLYLKKVLAGKGVNKAK